MTKAIAFVFAVGHCGVYGSFLAAIVGEGFLFLSWQVFWVPRMLAEALALAAEALALAAAALTMTLAVAGGDGRRMAAGNGGCWPI